ncbi:uncharacterized protein LOC104425497 [Eucalyptus grandis]|uniref:Uncharacterized protein n=2 Tax=Eucalyptus grandis TaxID=71139 RepID=A0ACC3IWP1_EUCGR|nr:uncharacterized protein LOC104425497 [Eucalyptus grandis]KAK3405610.1 hypothetical protein EUGRSUZ_K01842 [Eucalyptus grandis]
MNNAAKAAALINARAPCHHVGAAFFHSTPVLERKRRTHWEPRSNQYSRRFRRLHAKQTLLRNVDAYADLMFQRWQDEAGEDDPFLGRGSSWFKQYWTKGPRSDRSRRNGPQHWGRGGFQFCEEDYDADTIFKSAFGGNRFYFCSFLNDDPHWWETTSSYSNRNGRYEKWRFSSYDEYDSSSESGEFEAESSNRMALGLSASGPLKLEDVKNAYRACALKWHPDRHHGSSKDVAEEKFKLCSAAYQSLCDKLAVN